MALEEHSHLWRTQWVELEVGEGVLQLTAQKNRGALYFHILPAHLLQDQHLFSLISSSAKITLYNLQDLGKSTSTLAKPILQWIVLSTEREHPHSKTGRYNSHWGWCGSAIQTSYCSSISSSVWVLSFIPPPSLFLKQTSFHGKKKTVFAVANVKCVALHRLIFILEDSIAWCSSQTSVYLLISPICHIWVASYPLLVLFLT